MRVFDHDMNTRLFVFHHVLLMMGGARELPYLRMK